MAMRKKFLRRSLIKEPFELIEGPGLAVHISKNNNTAIIGNTDNMADFDMSILGSSDTVEPINRPQGYFTNSNPGFHSLDSAIDVYDQDI